MLPFQRCFLSSFAEKFEAINERLDQLEGNDSLSPRPLQTKGGSHLESPTTNPITTNKDHQKSGGNRDIENRTMHKSSLSFKIYSDQREALYSPPELDSDGNTVKRPVLLPGYADALRGGH